MSSPVVENPTLHHALTEATKLLVAFNANEEESMRTLQMYLLAAVLRSVNGNKCQAARRLGVHRNTMGRQILEFDLQPLVDHLRKTETPQLKLFPKALRGISMRSGYAQDVFVIRRLPQGKSEGNSQAYEQVRSVNALQSC